MFVPRIFRNVFTDPALFFSETIAKLSAEHQATIGNPTARAAHLARIAQFIAFANASRIDARAFIEGLQQIAALP